MVGRDNDVAKTLAFRYLLVLALTVATSCAKSAYVITGNPYIAMEVFASGMLVSVPLLLAIYGRWIQSIGLVIAGIANRDSIINAISTIIDSLGNDPNVVRTVSPIIKKLKNGILEAYEVGTEAGRFSSEG